MAIMSVVHRVGTLRCSQHPPNIFPGKLTGKPIDRYRETDIVLVWQRAANKTKRTGRKAMVVEEGFEDEGPVNNRINHQLTSENIRKLMDQIEAAVGPIENEEDYADLCDEIRYWVCDTFGVDREAADA